MSMIDKEILDYKQKIAEIDNEWSDNLCNSCKGTDYGSSSNCTIHFSCEGRWCGETAENLKEEWTEELIELKKIKNKRTIKKIGGITILGIVGYFIYKGIK